MSTFDTPSALFAGLLLVTHMGFTKLHASILDSSVWAEPSHIRILWITMLAMANEQGIVEASVGGLARRAIITLEECQQGLTVLCGPDSDSRDGTTGERVEKVPGGWFILNHTNYRDRQTESQAATALRVRRHRERMKQQKTVTDNAEIAVTGNDVTKVTPRNDLSPSEAEAEAEAEAEKTNTGPASPPNESVSPKPIQKDSQKFKPPNLDEVRAYCHARKSAVDPETFFAFYEANGWVQGNGRKPIQDWKMALVTWEKNDRGFAAKPASPVNPKAPADFAERLAAAQEKLRKQKELSQCPPATPNGPTNTPPSTDSPAALT